MTSAASGSGITPCIKIDKPHMVWFSYFAMSCNEVHCHSQNTKKVTHIKGRLLDQAVVLFNSLPFQNENFS